MTASAEQKRLMQEFYDSSGWEFMGIDGVNENDPQDFIDTWKRNIRWLEDKATETDRIIGDYQDSHPDEGD
jgi:hypothetical protein